jgi:hypothetical protein
MKLILLLAGTLFSLQAFAASRHQPQVELCGSNVKEVNKVIAENFADSFADKDFAQRFVGEWVRDNGEGGFSVSANGDFSILNKSFKVCPQTNGSLYGYTAVKGYIVGGAYLRLNRGDQGLRLSESYGIVVAAPQEFFRRGSALARAKAQQAKESMPLGGLQ